MALAYTTNSLGNPTNFGTLIQSVTRFGVTIVWFTTTPDTSQVKLGTTSGVLNLIYNDTTPGTPDNNGNFKHTMTIRGLTPNTKYFYSVGSTTGTVWFGGTVDEFFWTSPDTSVAQPTRIWCLADYGADNISIPPQTQEIAYAGFKAFNSNDKIDLWLSQGDQAYQSGNWGETIDKNFGKYADNYKQYPHFTTPGNHDWYGDLSYFDIYVTPAQNQIGGVASNSNKFYSFNYGNIHVISYDSDSLNLSATGSFYKWLRNDLINWETERNAGRLKWCIVISHYAPYSKGSHDSDATSEMIANRTIINPLLETYNVDLCLYGHSHNYERSHFIRGLYGTVTSYDPTPYPVGNLVQAGTGNPTPYDKTSGQLGTIYITNGWGGADASTKPGWPAAVNVVSITNNWGSTIIDFDTPVGGVQSMRVRAVQGPGGTVVDDFTIIK